MFDLIAPYSPAGDQAQAIKELCAGLEAGDDAQILLGVTGSGKTFTMANVIQQINRPSLIITHNKTLVAQLYGEFKQFFPHNAVEYYVSYYDYYQPEAYLPTTDTYIEKDLGINEEIEKLRLSTTTSLLSGRRDVIVVASVSCIYGLGNPKEYSEAVIRLQKGMEMDRNTLLRALVAATYERSGLDLEPGCFRVNGDVVDVNLPYMDHALRIGFWGDEIEELQYIEPYLGRKIKDIDDAAIFPATMYLAPQNQMTQILGEIREEMEMQVDYFKSQDQMLEALRLKERVEHDMEMIRSLGYCSGIENYSRFLDRRKPNDRPFCLLDYFPSDFVMFVDESHVTMPQIGAMYSGDRSRKLNLVKHGFRLPSALDNRPLNFGEFEAMSGQKVFVSATPGKYELDLTEGLVVEQVVRPTGLLDPEIEIRPTINQIDDLLEEIAVQIEKGDRVLVTTLTKRMAEELSEYLENIGIKSKYLHSSIDNLERVEIIRELRLGDIDVLVGVNLLREGLDIPEVSLVAIMDADKEGFLRDERSLTQIAGRAARNADGRVIFYADKITGSIQRTMDETNRRRKKQIQFNETHNVEPKTIKKTREEIYQQTSVLDFTRVDDDENMAADEREAYINTKNLEAQIKEARKKMNKAAKDMNFMEAAYWRDIMFDLQNRKKETSQ